MCEVQVRALTSHSVVLTSLKQCKIILSQLVGIPFSINWHMEYWLGTKHDLIQEKSLNFPGVSNHQRCCPIATDLQIIALTLVDPLLQIPLNIHCTILHHHPLQNSAGPLPIVRRPLGFWPPHWTWMPHHPWWTKTKLFLYRILHIMLVPVFQHLAPHYNLQTTHNAYFHLILIPL